MARDLLHPGFPHIKIGILFSMHGIIANIFSIKAWFFAISDCNSILLI
jgi:hypothetical protein